MDLGAATILAAAIAFASIAYQQALHWRETRRDKVLESGQRKVSAIKLRDLSELFGASTEEGPATASGMNRARTDLDRRRHERHYGL